MAELIPEEPLLSDLEQLLAALGKWPSQTIAALNRGNIIHAGQVYCSRCMRFSRVSLRLVAGPNEMAFNPYGTIVKDLTPSVWEMACLQCRTIFTALVFQGPGGPELAMFSSVPGGITTPNTPPPVAYYLDQAHRAGAAGANSAAVVMYRSALEHLLFGQGYKNGTCGTKINDLERDLKSGDAPKWARDLTPDDLRVLKSLGDGAIHPGEGDVAQQGVLDRHLLIEISLAFAALLDAVYERSKAEEERRAKLAKVAAEFKKPQK